MNHQETKLGFISYLKPGSNRQNHNTSSTIAPVLIGLIESPLSLVAPSAIP